MGHGESTCEEKRSNPRTVQVPVLSQQQYSWRNAPSSCKNSERVFSWSKTVMPRLQLFLFPASTGLCMSRAARAPSYSRRKIVLGAILLLPYWGLVDLWCTDRPELLPLPGE